MSNDSRGRGVRGANQRSDWDRDQRKALALLERAIQKSRYSQQRAFWCRRWVEWFLRWLGPGDWRAATADQLARFLRRHHQRGRPKWQLTQGLEHVLFFLEHVGGRKDLTVEAVRQAWKERPPEPTCREEWLARTRDQLRLRHYSLRTEQAYLQWLTMIYTQVLNKPGLAVRSSLD